MGEGKRDDLDRTGMDGPSAWQMGGARYGANL